MTELSECYVIDSLENIGKYASLGANFKKACDFIAKGDFGSLAPGRNEIDGDEVFVNSVEASYVLPSERRPEFHRDYFDIHVPLANDERIGLAPYAPCAGETFSEKDDCGFNDQAVEPFTVRRGEFAICWPKTCAHAPAITTDVPKKSAKLIFKVRAR